jgi:glutathione S-transferase
MKSMFKLYYAPGTCALATHIALEEAGADYEAERVDFESQAQRSPEYLAINPKGRVPALVTDQGALTETPGLLLFVAQRFPAAQLAPLADPFALAQAQEFNSYLCSTVHVAHAHGRRGPRWADDPAAIEAMKRKVPATMTECFGLIEHKADEGSLGHGRAVYDLRPLSLHDRHVARRRRGRCRQAAAGHGASAADAVASRGAKSHCRRRYADRLTAAAI